jgi:Tannase-like family of unknown function (DUF6351)
MRRAGVCAVALFAVLAWPGAALAHHRGAPRIEVLSNRADLISGGDALVAVTGRVARVTLNGADVTSDFSWRRGRLVGLVKGLVVGRNELRARSRRGPGARITITNHPIGGPVFAGPQVQPWVCKTIAGFPAPQDAQCDAPATTSFVYMDAGTHQFAPYDPASPPPAAQIATVTTARGDTVPYIVRVERGAMDRGLYEIAVLQQGWNHELLYQFGGGTAPHHSNGAPLSDLVDMALSRGFMVANNSLNTRGMNSNDVVSAEAVTMLEEHIREAYGRIRATLGTGCSGGSIQQHVIAADYPGLLDGIQPNCSYQDSWTTGNEVADCHLLLHYFAGGAAGFTPAQQVAVMGEQFAPPGLRVCDLWEATFASVSTPFLAANCDLPQSEVYDPVTNPHGVRCTPQDYESNVWGFRPDGFAKRPFDNVGVQYGLAALRAGTITPEQFVDLNERIGGVDIDNQFQAARTVGDPGSESTAYRTGKIVNGRALADVPIVDLRGSHNTFDIHSDYHSYVMRARLDAANGGHGNQIIWTWQGGPGLFQNITPDAMIAAKSLDLINRWVLAIKGDRRPISPRRKVLLDKPSDAVDACFVGPSDTEVTDAATCDATFPHFADPRIVAGSPLTDDVEQCRLQRLRASDYPGVTFTADQWARLQAAFPSGVCDFDRPGVGTRPSIPWLDYDVIGGRPLGPPPRSRG